MWSQSRGNLGDPHRGDQRQRRHDKSLFFVATRYCALCLWMTNAGAEEPQSFYPPAAFTSLRRGRWHSLGDGRAIQTRNFQQSEEAAAFLDPNQIYARPSLYDLAFSYRSYQDEVEFLLYAHQRHATTITDENNTNRPLRILEMAAGPARHLLTALELCGDDEVASVTAIDNCPEMVLYGKELAQQLLSSSSSSAARLAKFQYREADMRSLAPEKEENLHDTIWLLLGSFQHLLTQTDALDCLRSAARCLRPGGTMIVELPHPREAVFQMSDCTSEAWTVESNEEFGTLQVVWGQKTDSFDALTQVRQFTVEMTWDRPTRQRLRQVVPTRVYTAQELQALVQLVGNMSIVAMYGGLEFQEAEPGDDEEEEEGVIFRRLRPISIEDEAEAYRMVCVLHKEC